MNATNPAERRDSDRVPFASRVMILHRDSAWFAQLLDISEGGCGFFRPESFTLVPDDLVRLFFQDGESDAIIVPARVARVTETRIGMEYHDPQTVPPSRHTT
jgi:PilZ domain